MMVAIEISAPHWDKPLVLDFEGMAKRYGEERAIEIWDEVHDQPWRTYGDYIYRAVF